MGTDLSREANVGTHLVHQLVRLVQVGEDGVGHLHRRVHVQGGGDTQLQVRVDLGLISTSATSLYVRWITQATLKVVSLS